MENFSLFDPANALLLAQVATEHGWTPEDIEDMKSETLEIKGLMQRLRDAKNAKILELVDTLHAVNDAKA